MGIVGVAIVAALIGFGAKALGKANRPSWYGSILGASDNPTKFEKVGDVRRMVLVDPKVPGTYDYIATTDLTLTLKYQPIAVAEVKLLGVSKTNNNLAVGRVVKVLSYELTATPARKPLVGDTVLFD